jgi:hypothetical protein
MDIGILGSRILRKDLNLSRIEDYFFHSKSNFLSVLKHHAKFQKPYDNPFWEKSNAGGRRRREKTPLIVDT